MIDLREVNRDQFTAAKRWWAGATTLKLLLFAAGIWAVFLGEAPLYLPQIILAAAVASETLQVRSDTLKGRAERLLRTLDICHSFGRELSVADLRRIISTVPRRLRKRFESEAPDRSYFARDGEPGPAQAIANLIESSWYTGRQAACMAALYALLILIVLVTSVVALLVSSRELVTVDDREQVVKLVTAWLLLIVSLTMIRSAWAYFGMFRQCEKTQTSCEHLDADVDNADAWRHWFEYQVARAGCPLIPQWLWRLIGSSLDDAWKRADAHRPKASGKHASGA